MERQPDYKKAMAVMRKYAETAKDEDKDSFEDAITAIKLASPKTPLRQQTFLVCPNCGKRYTYRNPNEFKAGSRICNVCGQNMKW